MENLNDQGIENLFKDTQTNIEIEAIIAELERCTDQNITLQPTGTHGNSPDGIDTVQEGQINLNVVENQANDMNSDHDEPTIFSAEFNGFALNGKQTFAFYRFANAFFNTNFRSFVLK